MLPFCSRIAFALLLFGGIHSGIFAQDTLFFDTFESTPNFTLNTADVGSNVASYNDFVINNSYTGGSGSLICLGFPFTFTVNNTPPQPAAIVPANGNYLHLAADAAVTSGITCSSYQPADGTCQTAESTFARMSSDISTVGRSNVTVSFYWIGVMSATSFGELFYSTNGGTTWNQVTGIYNNQSTWTNQSLSDPSWDNQSTLRFGFRFLNNVSSTGADPALGVDNFLITGGTACTPTTGTAAASICDGDSIFLGGGFQTTAGTYTDTLLNAGGCDSLLNTTLSVNASPVSNVSASICDGDSIFLGGAFQTSSGTYTDVFSTPQGCDSIIITALTVNAASSSNASADICDGDSIFLGGAFQTSAGTYTDVFTGANGCDSTVVTALTVFPSFTQMNADTICDGDSIFVGGAFQTTAGTYIDNLSSTNGCDSTITTELAVSNINRAVTNNGGTLIANQNGASYQWIDCGAEIPIAGETGQTYTPTVSGNYAVELTFNGCTTQSDCENVLLEAVSENSLGISVYGFPNPASDQFHMEFGQIVPEFELTLLDIQGRILRAYQLRGLRRTSLDLTDLAPGFYTLRIQTAKGRAIMKLIKE